jgi:Fic family protein
MTQPIASSERGGNFEPQPGGYSAFRPRALPPVPPLEMIGSLHRALREAERELGRLDGAIQSLPDPDFFVLMYVRKEAVLSSQIEGTQSSLDDVLAAEAQVLDPDRPKDVAEVLNYVSAMRLGLQRLKDLPVSVRLLREIHARLLEGVRGRNRAPGELRRTQNWIGPRDATIADATFVPPPPQLVPDLLADLERFLHSEDDLPELVKIGLAHAQLETIHPFLDGNGRLGRLLITFLLCEKKMLREPVLYLSHHFKQHREEYYARLQAIRSSGDWESWITFFLNGVREVAIEAAATTRRIVSLREQHRTLVVATFGQVVGNGLRVLEQLYSLPVITAKQVQEITGVSYQASNELVARFVKHGILSEFTGRSRNRRFRYGAYIELFTSAPHRS